MPWRAASSSPALTTSRCEGGGGRGWCHPSVTVCASAQAARALLAAHAARERDTRERLNPPPTHALNFTAQTRAQPHPSTRSPPPGRCRCSRGRWRLSRAASTPRGSAPALRVRGGVLLEPAAPFCAGLSTARAQQPPIRTAHTQAQARNTRCKHTPRFHQARRGLPHGLPPQPRRLRGAGACACCLLLGGGELFEGLCSCSAHRRAGLLPHTAAEDRSIQQKCTQNTTETQPTKKTLNTQMGDPAATWSTWTPPLQGAPCPRATYKV